MEAFDRVIRPMYSRIIVNERESQILRNLRDSLLPRLISGELRVKVPDDVPGEIA
jgi:type I restriction enzyme S subunit